MKMNEEEFLEQLKSESKCAYNLLYHSFYSGIEKFIISNNGSKEDAQDIFQETLLILNRNISKEGFKLSSSLKTYIYSISKRLWLKSLRQSKPLLKKSGEDLFIHVTDNSSEESDLQSGISQFIEKVLSKIPYHCSQIVDYVYYKNIPIEAAAKQLGYNNTHTASNMKYKCIQEMKKVSDKNDLIL